MEIFALLLGVPWVVGGCLGILLGMLWLLIDHWSRRRGSRR